MPFSSSNTGSTDLRDTEVQQPNTAAHLSTDRRLPRLLGEQRPVGGRIDHHRFQLLAEHAALGVLLLDQHQHDVLQRGLADRHGAGQRVQDADLDRSRGRCAVRRRCAFRLKAWMAAPTAASVTAAAPSPPRLTAGEHGVV